MSQVIAANIFNISNLWIASALLGFAHGSTSAIIPTVCLEWFGLREYFLKLTLSITCTELTEFNYQLIFLKTGDIYLYRLFYLSISFLSSLGRLLMHMTINLSRTFSHLRSVAMMCRLAVCKAAIAMWMLFISPLVRLSFLSFLAFGPGIGIAGRLQIGVILRRELMFEFCPSRTGEWMHNTMYVQ